MIDLFFFFAMVLWFGPWLFVGLALHWQRLRSEKRRI